MRVTLRFVAIISIGAFLCLVDSRPLVKAQKADEATRKLWDTAFIDSAKSKKTTNRRRSSKRYRVATPNIPVDNVAPETVVGVTIWRLRPANRSDSGERLIVHRDDNTKEWIPERISANTRLLPGDKLRISVEAARTGYLYVIDREQYADGSLGEPYLIFPTTRTLSGENRVEVGKLMEIPAQADSPPYFTIRRSRPDQVAEVLSVLISPAPLEGVEISDKAQKLTAEQVARWEDWNTSVGRLEMATTGQAWTKDEKEATTRALTAGSPPPQLLFYRPNLKPGEPMLVKLRLQYRR